VSDDGKGITPEQATGAKSLGLLGMRERAAAVGGTLEIVGEKGKGTTVRVRVRGE
jgi:signal transduction histidine kinase